MAAIAAGDLRHRIMIQRPEMTQDATTGEMLTTWVNVAAIWAAIAPASGREFLAAAAEQSEVRGRMTIRYRKDIDSTMRIVYRGMRHNILAVLPDNESGIEHLTLMTSEGVRYP